ncbi:3-dehydroquinate synthase [Oceanobacillus limi]|uniref:3-dehydroquinate synthase n=1 Tax=Oceanobacillus limi TaxID=930131 RepID=A0A1H9ZI47_9BACI|nr:3-dehydroquinate synthase [Oceanobacillus limi]SES80494.1 3-dehydroquinate synthase [Oceanobacillus limi]
MKEIIIKSSSHTYPIYIGESIRFQLNEVLKEDYSSILVVTDDHLEKLYLNSFLQSLNHNKVHHATIPAGESSKSIEQFYQLHSAAIEYGLDRSSLLIAFGGGVVGDLAGFVAATYMRGIDYIQVPTTILAHDSSVGGKVAINHENGKNLIGSFYPPKMVVYDIEMLDTLPLKEIRSGYAELIKEALLSDESFYDELLNTNLQFLRNEHLIEHLEKGITTKATIVEEDERELGNRKYLNLGHTFGHALEAELGYGNLTHGESVAIGLLFALTISEKEFDMDMKVKRFYQWLKMNDYPFPVEQLNINKLFSRMKVDKKTVSQSIQMVLLKDIGVPVMVELGNEKINEYLFLFLEQLRQRENWE